MYLDHKSADPVTIYINSPGGSVISGMAIYDYIRLMRSPVTTGTPEEIKKAPESRTGQFL